MLVKVQKKPLKFAGRKYGVGETLEMDRKYARLFTTLGYVSKHKESHDVEGADANVDAGTYFAPEQPEKPARRYKRRDMRAE